jgi:hypothetical protein
MTSPSACTACCVPVIVPLASGHRSVRSARYARSPPSAAERPAPRLSRAGTSAATVRHWPVAKSLSAMTNIPAIIICLRPHESTSLPAGRFSSSIASAGADKTTPLALPLKPMDCAYRGSAGSSAPTPTNNTNCEPSKTPNGSATAFRGKPNTTSSSSFGSGELGIDETPRVSSVSASRRVTRRRSRSSRPRTRVHGKRASRLETRARRVARGAKDRSPDARVATERLFDAGETRGAFATANAPLHRIATFDITAPESTARGEAYTSRG